MEEDEEEQQEERKAKRDGAVCSLLAAVVSETSSSFSVGTGEATNGLLTRSWAVFELKVPTSRPNSPGVPRDPLETIYQGTHPTFCTH